MYKFSAEMSLYLLLTVMYYKQLHAESILLNLANERLSRGLYTAHMLQGVLTAS